MSMSINIRVYIYEYMNIHVYMCIFMFLTVTSGLLIPVSAAIQPSCSKMSMLCFDPLTMLHRVCSLETTSVVSEDVLLL